MSTTDRKHEHGRCLICDRSLADGQFFSRAAGDGKVCWRHAMRDALGPWVITAPKAAMLEFAARWQALAFDPAQDPPDRRNTDDPKGRAALIAEFRIRFGGSQ